MRGKGLSRDEIVQAYQDGESGHAIAKRLGCSPANVYQILWNAGIVPHRYMDHNRRTDIDAAKVASWYQDGWTVQEIADKLDTSMHTVYERLREAGVPRTGYRPLIPDEVIRQDYLSGLSCPQIAKKYGMATSGISRRIAAMGIVRSHGWTFTRKKKEDTDATL